MTAVFKKLNLKDQAEVFILNAPSSFEPELAELSGIAVRRSFTDVEYIDFSLAFVITPAELSDVIGLVTAKARGDAVIWFAYPKGSSKKYKSDLNRDKGWSVLDQAGFLPVRQVAIDDDWSAVRFRRVEYIKKLTRRT